MLELSPLGHATLLVKGGGILVCDPILADSLSGGGNCIDPPRRINLSALGEPDAVLLTHHHSDHFDPEAIAMVSRGRRAPVIAPAGSPVVAALRERGYFVDEVRPGDRRSVSGFAITATPSDAPFPEVGYLFERGDASALNLADSLVHHSLQEIRQLAPRPDLVLAPFQAGGYMSLLPLRVPSPPGGLAEAIRRWSAEFLEEFADDVAALAPCEVVPFADGIIYRDAAINHWHCPLRDEDFVEALRQRGVSASSAGLGWSYRVRRGRVERAEAGAVIQVLGARGDRAFDPGQSIGNGPLPLTEGPVKQLPSPSADEILATMTDRVRDAFQHCPAAERTLLRECFAEWDLELCDISNPGTCFLEIDCGSEPWRVRPVAGNRRRRPFGIRAHWRDLHRVLKGEIPLEFIELSGAFRYRSPDDGEELESIRSRVLAPLRALVGAAPRFESADFTPECVTLSSEESSR